MVELSDGSVLDRVFVQGADDWFPVWGADPEDNAGNGMDILEVVSLRSSPSRLPPVFADSLYSSGNQIVGRECLCFHLILADGRRLDCTTGDVLDFPE